ncbi:TIGR02301 family protein [Camelimonas abortus]|uniref:TIGR02301 family protein n=1 Tax=Camelimonas abortus TaxID=1017184 RepID=A0ABV7LDS6_9HYPH
MQATTERGGRMGPPGHGWRRLARAGAVAAWTIGWAALAASAPPPATAASTAAQVDRSMARLAEIMGALSWLRQLCGAADALKWRERLQALADAESGAPMRRELLVSAFNAGRSAYSLSHRRCTPATTQVITRYLAEGEELARALAALARR